MNVFILLTPYYDIIDISEGIGFDKTSASKSAIFVTTGIS